MKISQKIILTTGTLIFIVLLIQGVVYQILVRNDLKSSAFGRLNGEVKARAQSLNNLLQHTRQDLSAMKAHKAFEDYFTSRELDDGDGMLDSEFELESFFIRINSAKPQYTRIQLATAAGEPLLQIAGNSRIERLDKYDHIVTAKQLREKFSNVNVVHNIFLDEKDGEVLLSVGRLVFNEKIVGFLWIYQPINNYIEQIFSDLSDAGIYYTISNDEGIFISHSTNVQPKILTGLLNGDLPNWLISMESVPELGLTVSMGIEKGKAFKVINHLLLIGIGVLVVAVAFSMLVLSIIASSISKPIKNLVMWTERLSKGDLRLEDIKITNDEIGELNASYRKVVNSLQEAASVCDSISNGDFSRSLKVKSYKDTLGKSVNKMIHNLRDLTAENKKESWLKTGQTKLNDRIRGGQNIATLSQNIISCLVTYLNVQIGALYLANDNNVLELAGTYAYTRGKSLSNKYTVGEGLIGQAALEKQSILITDTPDDYIKIQSGLGESIPRNIIVMPVLYEDTVKGVIELGSLHEITDLQVAFLKQVSENIAISLISAQFSLQREELLKKTLHQSATLEAQQEELQQTNEELESQTQALKESESKLQAQQEELRQANEELKEQTMTLERQKEEIKKKNIDLEKTQQSIQEKAKELEISSKYKSEFLANMSHELRTPLNSLLLLSKLLAQNKDNNLTDKQIEFANTIHSAGSDLLTLINDILDLSKIEVGKMEINIDNLNIDDFISNIERNFRHMAQEKGISLKINKHDGIPTYIRTDRQRLEQIIKNLLSNAFKFTSKGGITISIQRPVAKTDLSKGGLDPSRAIAIAVSDTGIGIPEDKQRIIFEAFQQVDGTTSRIFGGTGLGLSISRELSRFLGGEIQLRSIENEGTTFTIYLPEQLEKSSQVEAQPPESQQSKDASIHKKDAPARDKSIVKDIPSDKPSEVESSISKDIPADRPFELEDIRDDRKNITSGDRSILIIEDDPKFAKILYDITIEKGFKGLIAGDGETGLHFADYFKPSAIILDISLPRMDGWTVMKRLKDSPETRHIPVHFISAYEKGLDAMKMGAIGYQTKPVNMEGLNEAFKKIEDAISKTMKNLIVVEDNKIERKVILEVIGNGDIKTTAVGTGQEAYELLSSNTFDCMILDIGLPDMSGFELLKKIKGDKTIQYIPIIIYTARDLTEEETEELKKYTQDIIIKGVRSPERLLDEAVLFLHRVEADLPEEKQKMLRMVHDKEVLLKDKKILLVDDDMRNTFALSNVLEEKGMKVLIGKNGKNALECLDKNPDVQLVLMDIMMPEMDGYEAMKEIRKQQRFKKLPIIAFTAKAMKGDKKKCIDAGANDYLPKPVDVDKLLSLLRVWLY